MKWKDVSSYSKKDKERIPHTWELRIEGLRIVVTRHIYYPLTWLLICRELGIDGINLHNDNVDEAKSAAIELILSELTTKRGQIEKQIEEITKLKICEESHK